MPKVPGSQEQAEARAQTTEETAKVCRYCQEGRPTRLQATSWSGKTVKPVHDVEEYPGFAACVADARPRTLQTEATYFLFIECPVCQAEVGKWCPKTVGFDVVNGLHAKRLDKADDLYRCKSCEGLYEFDFDGKTPLGCPRCDPGI